VFEVEENADRLVEFLRDRSASQSTAVEGLRRRSLALAVAFALVLPLFALAAGLYLARGIARPLALVGEVAARISRGDLRARIVPRGPSELTALGVELNAMAAALEHHQERLLRSEKLAGLGRLAAGVAHEINNPLQVMLGYLALHRGKVPGELGADLARVEREASRCREIVEGLLQLSRPAVMAPPEPVDLRQLADEVAEAIRVTTPGVRLRVRGAGRALGSAPRLRQVILNLVKNAAEAAGPSGVVEIEVGGEGATASVVVTDSGPGIPPSVRGRVFEPFFTTKPGGTGLGLALARAIAQAHGGDVELEDTPAGARFCLRAQRCGEGGWT
jgi:signal transduction histidine kinase